MQKNDNILNLNDQKEKYKKTLNEIIKKLNLTISKNTDVLYDDNLDEDHITLDESDLNCLLDAYNKEKDKYSKGI